MTCDAVAACSSTDLVDRPAVADLRYPAVKTLYLTASSLNVLSGPSASAGVLGKVARGSPTRALGESGD